MGRWGDGDLDQQLALHNCLGALELLPAPCSLLPAPCSLLPLSLLVIFHNYIFHNSFKIVIR
ncbi:MULTISPECIES: hypothetical protein [Moorena]|uniref:Uncharacterized protein n=1 Tax=Moorena producens 3L TaxID=489825 RepID=F4XN75_9CYAN|nr:MULTISPECIES: hypothetical protein [Moorena]EGJ34134.1 hypothetical protein LYNGBM3L_21310 [Moorena producens 3L]NEP35463.1 hypothetical protein [Moorena sp. SIO3B2]NEQ17688.1 hypothetical protein [Moorena sp. SIO3E2]OLT65099.1 hypothetical protein BI334_08680 [Moorena producens 3L]